MQTRRTIGTVALGAAASLLLAACSGGSSDGASSPSSSSSSGSSTPVSGAKGGAAAYNAAANSVIAPSTKTGGTLKYALTDAPDSMDPGNTYYAFNWNFTRLYARPLVTFKTVPGKDGLTAVPDLAASLGVASDGGKTWTYKLRPGLKFEDGTAVKATDVAYAVARSNYSAELTDGPKYFAQYLTNTKKYAGPYKDKTLADLSGITTPDDATIVFHLTAPFSEFDYLVSNPQTAPVPAAKDTGLKYEQHPVSTGPYMFQQHTVGVGFTLVKNPQWTAASDPNRKQLVDQITLQEKIAADDIDNRLLSGAADVALDGTGVQAQARSTILQDDAKKKDADNPLTGFLRYAMIDTTVAPFDNKDCRLAVLYAADHKAIQNQWGGPLGGDIATTALPGNIAGSTPFDLYDFKGHPNGDPDAAKKSLAACGKPTGFSTNIAVRGDRPKDVASGEALQQALKKVGINAAIKKYPAGDWSARFAGNPQFVKANNLGIIVAGWGADWPSGFGFLSQLVDGRAIKPTGGNYNQMELNDPSINKLLDQGITTTDTAARNTIWGQVDRKVMESGALLPFVYEKTLLYRPETLTNVFVTPAYGMYDYTALGKK